MDVLGFVSNVFFALHMLGLAAIIGAFFVQLRRKTDFVVWPLLAGSITQVVTGLALVGMRQAAGKEVDFAWVGVKFAIAFVVLLAAIVAVVMKRRGGRVQPWFHTAGGLAVVNVLVASLWP